MKKRIKLDLMLTEEEFNKFDFSSLINLARDKGVIINAGEDNEEKTGIDIHDCKHDDGLPCTNNKDLMIEDL